MFVVYDFDSLVNENELIDLDEVAAAMTRQELIGALVEDALSTKAKGWNAFLQALPSYSDEVLRQFYHDAFDNISSE